MNEGFATELRDAVQALMEADPYYLPVTFVSEQLKDIEEKINETIAISGGIAIILVTPSFEGVLQNVPGANFSDIKLIARVLENTKLNDTGLSALNVAIHTAALWSQLKPDALSCPLRVNSVLLGNDPKFLSWDVEGATEGGATIDVPQLAAPTGNFSNLAAITLTHATPGAAIFYTLDGSAPVPRNPATALFLAPFASSAGTTLRARAWLAGFIPSAELRQVL